MFLNNAKHTEKLELKKKTEEWEKEVLVQKTEVNNTFISFLIFYFIIWKKGILENM